MAKNGFTMALNARFSPPASGVAILTLITPRYVQSDVLQNFYCRVDRLIMMAQTRRIEGNHRSVSVHHSADHQTTNFRCSWA